MAAVLMPGGPVADAVFDDLRPRIRSLIDAGHTPGLGTILVGDESASVRYVRMKMQKAEELGCHAPHVHLPEDASQADLLAAIREFNDDPAVDAMLVQHPTPPQIDFDAALLAMDPDKDVDGLHPVNMGRLALMMPGPVPCTPAGIEALLAYYGVEVSGQEVCILGRGTTLGRPLPEARHRERGRDRRAHGRARLAPLHAPRPHRDRSRGRARDPPARAHHARRGGGRRRRALRGAQAAARRRRALRGGGGVHHPASRRRGAHDDRDAVPQRHRGRGAASEVTEHREGQMSNGSRRRAR
jgi:hypothetical protein